MSSDEADCLVCGQPARAGQMVNYRLTEQDGLAHLDCLPSELALAIADTAFVFDQVGQRIAALPEGPEQALLVYKGMLVTAMAKWAGIAASLAWLEQPVQAIEGQLTKLRAEGLPEGWPFDRRGEECWPWTPGRLGVDATGGRSPPAS